MERIRKHLNFLPIKESFLTQFHAMFPIAYLHHGYCLQFSSKLQEIWTFKKEKTRIFLVQEHHFVSLQNEQIYHVSLIWQKSVKLVESFAGTTLFASESFKTNNDQLVRWRRQQSWMQYSENDIFNKTTTRKKSTFEILHHHQHTKNLWKVHLDKQEQHREKEHNSI